MLIFKDTQLKNWWSTVFFLFHFIHLVLCLTKLICINTILIRLAQIDTVSCLRLHKSHDLRISVIVYFYVPTSDPGCWQIVVFIKSPSLNRLPTKAEKYPNWFWIKSFPFLRLIANQGKEPILHCYLTHRYREKKFIPFSMVFVQKWLSQNLNLVY